MTILQANLKHLYQRKGFWLIGLGLGLFAFMCIMAIVDGEQGSFMVFAVWIYIAAGFTSALQVEVLTRPFSWSLPGHARIPVKFLFCIGISVSLFWSVVFLFYPAPTLAEHLLSCVSVFFAGTIIYWLGAWVVFRFPNWVSAIVLVPILMVYGRYLDLYVLFERVIVDAWFAVILLGGLVNFLAWRHWSRPGMARKYCGRPWLGAFDAWNKEKISEFQQARLAQRNKAIPTVLPRVEKFFLDRITDRTGPNTAQYIWGGLYRSFGLIASRKRECVRFWLIMLPLLCFLGYMGPAANIIFIMPGLMVANMSLHVRSTLLVSGGRTERFWSALSTAAVATLLATVTVTLMAALTLALQAVMPELTIKGQSAVYRAMEMKLFFIPLCMMPLTLTIALIFYRYPRLMMGVVMMIFILAMQVSVFLKILPIHPKEPGPIHIIIIITLILLCCWAIFTAVLRHICMRRCLVR